MLNIGPMPSEDNDERDTAGAIAGALRARFGNASIDVATTQLGYARPETASRWSEVIDRLSI